MIPEEGERLPALANDVLIRVRFSGSKPNETPALKFGDVNLIGYLDQESGVYVTCEHAVSQSVSTEKIDVEVNIPSGTTVRWYGMNDGDRWEEMTLVETKPVDHLWTEYRLSCEFQDSAGRKVPV
ncbi:hypothetical protein [Acanthopleuribacter pedis]|uniref:Uncharacterized protein n=1 Tax=Acanthopleuribacter pedis TaxID=442870 RepID=A0A8J7Q9M6_9BACT|nr:hypothetical protein [Acanthopleuribacter pedis]MBO1320262.1 hypothetical protein [Acanthopleuribacter pedis]